MLAALLLVAILAGSVSALGGALLGHLGWISLGLYTGGGLSGNRGGILEKARSSARVIQALFTAVGDKRESVVASDAPFLAS